MALPRHVRVEPIPAPGASTEERMDRIEARIDRVLAMLERIRADSDPPEPTSTVGSLSKKEWP